MIDFVTRENDVIVIRDNHPYFYFSKDEVLQNNGLLLIQMLEHQIKMDDDWPLTPTEENEILDLQRNLIEVENNLM